MSRLLFKDNQDWKGTLFTNELYEYDENVKLLMPVTQVQAVCFIKSGEVVLYKYIDGWYGLPGGKVETGESF